MKKLIILGAILVVIVIVIVVAVLNYYNSTGIVDADNSLEYHKQIIEAYEGAICDGYELKQLIRKVNTYNKANIFPIDLTFDGVVSGDAITGYDTSSVKRSGLYSVELEYSEGYVSKIKVTAVDIVTPTSTVAESEVK